MEQVQSGRSNGIFFVLDNFLYMKDHSQGRASYFACRRFRTHLCPGRLWWRDGSSPQLKRAHNHQSDEQEVGILRLKEVLRERAASERMTTFKNIFREEELRHWDAAEAMGGYTGAIKSMMARARQQSRFSPTDFENIHIILTESMSQGPIMKFCANLSFMFTEQPFLERYRLAKEAGFKAVESGFPLNFTEKQVLDAKTKADVQQILINTYTGDVTRGELGFAAIPGKEQEFKNSLQQTVNYAKTLGARKIHIMSGKVAEPTENHHKTYEENLRFAVKLLEKEDILGVIEPINNHSVPNYYLNCYDRALSVVKQINSPKLKIMLDIFHLQHIRGNVTNNIKDLSQYIGHVQIAQVPNRNEPDTPGELNYEYVLEVLKNSGYNDWIGLEYKPAGDPKVGLKWVENFGYSL